MKVKDLMSTNITCVDEDASVGQIASHMRRNNVGSIPVCDDAGYIKGIVTDRDLVVRTVAKFQANAKIRADAKIRDDVSDSESFNTLKNIKAKDIMTKDPVTTSPDHNIHEAALLFASHKIRRLPVTEASKLIGMLSLGDIAVKPVYIDEAGDALSSISLADGLQSKS